MHQRQKGTIAVDIDLGRAFSFITDDEEWVTKILVGGLLLLIPIIGQFALLGYVFEVGRNVYHGSEQPLPRWNDFGNKLLQGLVHAVISFLYSLPILVPICLFVGWIVMIGTRVEEVVDEVMVGFSIAGGFLCLIPVLIVLGLLLQMLMFVAYVRYIQTESLGAALNLGDILGMFSRSLGGWFILLLINILCGFVAGLGSIGCGIGVLFTTVYAQAVFGHALGQAALQLRMQSEPGYESWNSPQ